MIGAGKTTGLPADAASSLTASTPQCPRFRMDTAAWIATSCWVAAVLIVAGVGKLWIGATLFELTTGVVEIALAVLALTCWRWNILRAALLGLFGGFAAVHWLRPGNCGCFGVLEVAPTFVSSVVLVSILLLSASLLHARPRHARMDCGIVATLAAMVALVVWQAGIWSQSIDECGRARSLLLDFAARALDEHPMQGSVLFATGDLGCPECCRRIAAIASIRLLQGWRVFVVSDTAASELGFFGQWQPFGLEYGILDVGQAAPRCRSPVFLNCLDGELMLCELE